MALRKLSWILLLPLLLLFAQQGQLRHEYGHYGQQAASCQAKAPVDVDHCPQCLAFCQIAGVAHTAVATPALLSGLSFHFTGDVAVAGIDAEGVSPRSRGPPSL